MKYLPHLPQSLHPIPASALLVLRPGTGPSYCPLTPSQSHWHQLCEGLRSACVERALAGCVSLASSLWSSWLAFSVPARLGSPVPITFISWSHISLFIRLTQSFLQASVYSLGYLPDLKNTSAIAAFFSHSTRHACLCCLILDPLYLPDWKSDDHLTPGPDQYTNVIIWIWNVSPQAHIYFIYVHECFPCKYVCEPLSWPVLDEVKRGHQTHWNWSHRWLLATMWVLGTKSNSSGRDSWFS